MVSKHRESTYRAGRFRHWIKVKNRARPALARVMDQFRSTAQLDQLCLPHQLSALGGSGRAATKEEVRILAPERSASGILGPQGRAAGARSG